MKSESMRLGHEKAMVSCPYTLFSCQFIDNHSLAFSFRCSRRSRTTSRRSSSASPLLPSLSPPPPALVVRRAEIDCVSLAGTRSFPISSEMSSRCVECRVIVLGARDPGRGRRGRDDRASCETDASPSFPLSQILDVNADDEEEEGAAVNEDSKRSGKSAVIKTSTRQVSRGTARERKPHADDDTSPPDRLPPACWPGSLGEAEAGRPYWCEQGFIPHPRHAPCWYVSSLRVLCARTRLTTALDRVRLESQGDGGRGAADGDVHRHRRTGQADRGARRGHVRLVSASLFHLMHANPLLQRPADAAG